MGIESVGIVGCGLMGSGIADVAIRAGCTATVSEVSPEAVEAGRARVERSLAVGVEKGKLAAADRDAALARLRFTTRLEELAGCDLVVEAATENPDTKKAVFRALDRACKPATILASNTSSIPIVELAAVTGRPDRVVGLHFFNPVPVMKLVEVVRSIVTSEGTVAAVRGLAERLGKRAIVARDRAGFVVNVLLVPYLLDAVRLLEQGIATREDIDEGMRLGCGHPMGPLQLLDFVGNDTVVAIAEILYDELKEPRYAAPTLLKQMVIAGLHGRKAGRGFYDYGAKAL
jgi:3-hydroxybutyryl-CoA dehydrogenase